MDQSLAELVRLGLVTREMAFERAFDREAFRSMVGMPHRETGQTPGASVPPSPTPGAAR